MNKIIIHALLATLYLNTCSAADFPNGLARISSRSSASSFAAQQSTERISDARVRSNPIATIERLKSIWPFEHKHKKFIRALSSLHTEEDLLNVSHLTRYNGRWDIVHKFIWERHAHRLSPNARTTILFNCSLELFESFFNDWQHNFKGNPTETLERLVTDFSPNQSFTLSAYVPRLLQRGANPLKASAPDKKSAWSIVLKRGIQYHFISAIPEAERRERIFAMLETGLKEYTPNQSSAQEENNLLFDSLKKLIGQTIDHFDFNQKDLLALDALIEQYEHKKDQVTNPLFKAIHKEVIYFEFIACQSSDSDREDTSHSENNYDSDDIC